ncbi:hypothetical protein D3C85_1849440 [compost metagenome]
MASKRASQLGPSGAWDMKPTWTGFSVSNRKSLTNDHSRPSAEEWNAHAGPTRLTRRYTQGAVTTGPLESSE